MGGGERSEVALVGPSDVRSGDQRWYHFSLLFEEEPRPNGRFLIIMQWHGGDGPPALAIGVNERGELVLENHRASDTQRSIGVPVIGRWASYAVKVIFSRWPADGGVEVWRDGRLVVPWQERSTLSSDRSYFKVGLYRDSGDSSGRLVMWLGDLRIVASDELVA
jgi:hypothetical protein